MNPALSPFLARVPLPLSLRSTMQPLPLAALSSFSPSMAGRLPNFFYPLGSLEQHRLLSAMVAHLPHSAAMLSARSDDIKSLGSNEGNEEERRPQSLSHTSSDWSSRSGTFLECSRNYLRSSYPFCKFRIICKFVKTRFYHFLIILCFDWQVIYSVQGCEHFCHIWLGTHGKAEYSRVSRTGTLMLADYILSHFSYSIRQY